MVVRRVTTPHVLDLFRANPQSGTLLGISPNLQRILQFFWAVNVYLSTETDVNIMYFLFTRDLMTKSDWSADFQKTFITVYPILIRILGFYKLKIEYFFIKHSVHFHLHVTKNIKQKYSPYCFIYFLVLFCHIHEKVKS